MSQDAQSQNSANNGAKPAQLLSTDKNGEGVVTKFPNGKQQIEFDEFIDVIRDACIDSESAENYLVLAFSMFDIEK